jgi:hypothetical protein
VRPVVSALPVSLALTLALAPPPADVRSAASRLVAERPAATALRAEHGGLSHLSAIAEPRRAAADEENARHALARVGAALGVHDPASLETVRVLSSAASGGVAVFRRTAGGLPIFGGEVAVGWRADGAVTSVNGSRALATEPRGSHPVGAHVAVDVALAAAGGPPGEVAAEPGWLEFGGALVPVHRVAHGALGRASYSFVDAESGALLYRMSRVRRHAAAPEPWGGEGPRIRGYLASPLSPPPPGPLGNVAEDFVLKGLPSPAPGSTLSGERTTVYNCAGYDQNASDFLRTCRSGRTVDGAIAGGQTARAEADGSFLAESDPTHVDPRDAFAEQSAYLHIDAHSRFLDSLDPAFAVRTPAGGVGFVPGYVNAYDGRAPLDNAYFMPGAGPVGSPGVLVFGQGAGIDLAYDAEVLYHELTHAAVDVTAGLQGFVDARGVNADPDALNEGVADTFAFLHVPESARAAGLPIDGAACLSPYFGAALGLDCLRRADNVRTCRGAGPNSGANPGRTGEVHDDGEIWTGYTWALYSEAARQGHGPAMARALFKALTALHTPGPTFSGFAATVEQKIRDSALEPLAEDRLPPDAVTFAACVAAQRDLAGCDDRAVPLHSGERAQGVVYGLLTSGAAASTAGQQYVVDVPCGATALRIQTGDVAGGGTLYVRHGQPVEFGTPGLAAPRYDWMASGNFAELRLSPQGCDGCAACGGTRTALGAGRWYLLRAGQPGAEFHVGVSIEMADGQPAPARPRSELGTCTWGGEATPTGGSPAHVAAEVSGCPAPAALPASPACEPASAGGSRGGCSHTGTSGGLLGLAALAALRRRSRRPAAVHSLRV